MPSAYTGVVRRGGFGILVPGDGGTKRTFKTQGHTFLLTSFPSIRRLSGEVGSSWTIILAHQGLCRNSSKK